MNVTQLDVNGVLQFKEKFLRKAVLNVLRTQGGACLDTSGATITVGNKVLRADNVSLGFKNVSSAGTPTDPAFKLELEAKSGKLEAGPNAQALSQVSSVAITMPLDVSVASGNSGLLEMRVPVGLPQYQTVILPLLDLANIRNQGMTLQYAQDPARIKRLDPGALAVGIRFDGGGGTGFSTFLQSYSENRVPDNQTGFVTEHNWALLLDEWTVHQFVQVVDIAKNQSRLRNVDLWLKKIADGHFKLRAKGEFDTQTSLRGWENFKAFARGHFQTKNPGTENAELWVHYSIKKVIALDIPGEPEVTSWVPAGQKTGTVLFRDPASVGDASSPLGRLYAWPSLIEPGQVVMLGEGKIKKVEPPELEVTPTQIALGNLCAGTAPGQVVVVKNPANQWAERQADLQVCSVEITDQDADEWQVEDSSPSGERVPPGQKVEYSIGFTGQQEGTSEAEVVIRTNAGTKRVPIHGNWQDASVDAPDQRDFSDKEGIGPGCPPIRDRTAETTIPISNLGPGAVSICSVSLHGTTGGTWETSGPEAEETVLPGTDAQVNVIYTADENDLDTWNSAQLKVETSMETVEVDLQAIVHASAFRGRLPEPLSVVTDGFCIEVDEVGTLFHKWKVIQDAINGPELRDEVEPICCPPPQQPYCLCRPGIEGRFEGLPEESRFHVIGPEGEEIARLDVGGDSPTTLPFVPVGDEREGRFELSREGGGHTEGKSASVKIRKWSINRVGLWDSNAELQDLAVHQDRLVALETGAVKVFTVQDDGHPVERVSHEVDVKEGTLSSHDSILRIHDQQGDDYLVRIDEDDLKTVGRASQSFQGIFPKSTQDSDQPRSRLGTRKNRVVLLNPETSTNPRVTASLNLTIEPQQGIVFGRFAAFIGSGGVQFCCMPDRNSLKEIEVVKSDRLVSVFALGDKVYVLDDNRHARIFEVREDEDNVKVIGEIQFPESWEAVLPGGVTALYRGDMVSARYSGRGFNILHAELGTLDGGAEFQQPDSELAR